MLNKMFIHESYKNKDVVIKAKLTVEDKQRLPLTCGNVMSLDKVPEL